MEKMWKLLKALVLFAISTNSVYAEQALSQLELNEFFIGQHVSILYNDLGQPMNKKVLDDGRKYMFYPIDGDPNGYLSFMFTPGRIEHIYEIQITGAKTAKTKPFLGLRLGDDRAQVERTLGKPSSVTAQSNKKLLVYEEKNYSVMIDQADRLSSIKIFGLWGFPEKPENYDADLLFKEAVVSQDVEKILRHIMPDVRIFKGGKEYMIKRSLRKEFKDQNSNIRKLLLQGPNSIYASFRKENTKTRAAMRMYGESKEFGFVVAFEDSKIIQEIVFSYWGGEWRAWKIYLK